MPVRNIYSIYISITAIAYKNTLFSTIEKFGSRFLSFLRDVGVSYYTKRI